MSEDVEVLREEFEALTVSYVNQVIKSELTLEDLKERRGNDGNYWCHNLSNAMWISFLLSRIGIDRVLVHLKIKSIH